MSFLKRFFGEKKEEADLKKDSEPLNLDLSEVEGRVRERLRDKKSTVLTESLYSVEEILREKKIARGIIEHIKETDFDEDIKERTYKPILTSKPIYVRGMIEGLKGIKEKKPESFEELEGFHKSTTKALKSIQSVQLKQGRYMSFAFRVEMIKLGSALNKVIDETEKLGGNLSELQDLIQVGGEVIKNAVHLQDHFNEIEEGEKHAKKATKRVAEKEREIKSVEKEIKDLEDSKEYREYLNEKAELEALKISQKNLENSIFNLISPLKRPFRKFEKFLERRGSDSDKKLLEKLNEYQETPKTAFLKENPHDIVLEKLISSLKEALISGDVKLHQKEKAKTFTKVESLSGDQLKKLLREHIKLREKKDLLNGQLTKSVVLKRRETLIKKREGYETDRNALVRKAGEESFQKVGLIEYKEKIEEGMSKLVEETVVLQLPELLKESTG
jgi:cell division protein FtsB